MVKVLSCSSQLGGCCQCFNGWNSNEATDYKHLKETPHLFAITFEKIFLSVAIT